MKNSIKISSVFFLACCFIFSSCEKDDDHDHNSEVLGCMDDTACNYNELANTDDGSCTYAEQYFDCNGNCLNDLDGDGICDELEVSGCTDNTACNYETTATFDDGSCLYNDGTWQPSLEVIPFETTVYGQTETPLESYVYIQNYSCNNIPLKVTEMYDGPGITQFCFAGECYAESVEISPNNVILQPFAINDGEDSFKSIFYSADPGEFQVNYKFEVANNPSIFIEISITYIVS